MAKLNVYVLLTLILCCIVTADEGGDKQSTSEPATGEKTASTQPSSSTVYFDHPDHFVVVDTQPNFGNSLTNMCNEHSDTELT